MANLLYLRIISRLIKYVCLIGIVSHCTMGIVFAQMFPGGVLATPTFFEVTIFKVDFQKGDGGFVPFVDGVYTFNLGTASGGTDAGGRAGICPGIAPLLRGRIRPCA